MSPEALRNVLNRCPDLGDIILQAFIARQQLLRESASFTGLCVIGSRYSHDTFRVRDFLARNRVWFTWLDLESNPQVNQLLKQFGVTEADTLVVACGHMLLLRNPSNRVLAEAIGIRKRLDQQVYDLAWSVAGPRDWRLRSMVPLKDSRRWCWSAPRPAVRPVAACGSRTISAFPPG